MSTNPGNNTILDEVVSAYSHCPRKAYLLHCTDERGTPQEYQCILEERTRVTKARYLASLRQVNTSIGPYNHRGITSGMDIVTDANLKAGSVGAYCDVLTKVSSTRRTSAYEPTLVVGTYRVEKEHVIKLSVVGYVLGQLGGKAPIVGHLVTADDECHRASLQPVYKTVASIVELIAGWSGNSPAQPPPVLLNKHCPYCPFKSVCAEQAKAADDLSLLDRMTPKIMRRYHSKGIFTVNQLSFLFKPRRKRRRHPARPHFDLEMQALAIRTGKIYIQTMPEVPRRDVELFLDVEGVPNQQFSYLVGLLIKDHEAIAHHAFWADSIEDEETIWYSLLQKTKEYADAPIYHYGSYEPRLIETLTKKFGAESASLGDRLVNLTSHVYGKVYFPVRSNSLKELGRVLGASWTPPDASGLQSLVWRYRWEEQREDAYKQKLISYNAEDCRALLLLVDELSRLRAHADSELNVDYVDQPKQNATNLGNDLHAAFDRVLRCARIDSHKGRLSLRPGTDITEKKGPGAPKGHQAYQRIIPSGGKTVIRVAPKRTCPKHSEEGLKSLGTDAEAIVVDLAFTTNGCRKTLTKYVGEKRCCPQCGRSYDPPAIKRLGGQLFGHCFRAWAVYQRIILRLPYRVITQTMEDLFRERTTEATVINFIDDFAEYYSRTGSILLKRSRESPFVHVDETRLSIRGVDHYVWVFTDGQHVVFRLTETRETAVVQEVLEGYQGVLVSDFYAGYDAVGCRQEKCWVHLIRDLNEDLWKFPFAEELQTFVLEVKNLIVPIIEAVDRWGPKARHLRKFKKQVGKFYATVIESAEYALDATKKYQKRFARYRESLFRFLDEDGIPWNNNTAERAIRHLAVQRKISGTLYKRGAVKYLELLGIAQTCRFQKKSFLKFLLAEQIDVDRFQFARRIKISRPIERRRELHKIEDSIGS